MDFEAFIRWGSDNKTMKLSHASFSMQSLKIRSDVAAVLVDLCTKKSGGVPLIVYDFEEITLKISTTVRDPLIERTRDELK